MRSTPSTAGCLRTLCGCAVLIAFMAGCAETPKDGDPKSNTAQPAQQAPPPKAAKAEAAPVARPAPAAATTEKPVQTKADDEPIGQKDGKEKPPAGQPAEKPTEFGPDTKVATEADREALAKLIMEQALAAQKANAAQQAEKPATPQSPAATSLNMQRKEAQPPPTTQPAPASQPAAKPGCGATGESQLDLTPPAPDQPQPKLVVKEPKVKAEGVWAGQQAVFKFVVANEGEGPLAIRLRGG